MSEAPRWADRRAEGAGVESSGTLYRALVESVVDYAIFALDSTGHILSWNRGAAQLKGYDAGEIIGLHFSVFYPPEDVAARKPDRELETAAREGRVEDEGWRVRKDGSKFWANVIITAVRDQSGILIGFAKVTRDLTARRQALEELRTSEQRFRLLVQSVKDYAILMLDATGRIATWNDGAHRLKGYTATEIIGKHFSIFYPPEDVADGKPERELAIAVDVGDYKEEGWRVRQDGSRFWASVVITAIHGPDGTLAGFAKVTRDLTARREAEEESRQRAAAEAARVEAERVSRQLHELNVRLHVQAAELELRTDEARSLAEELEVSNESLQRAVQEAEDARDGAVVARAEAETANRAKADFLATMSHELRTPLNAIGGYTELLTMGLHGPVTDAQRDALERIERSQRHLQSLIEDILGFARIEAGHLSLTITNVALHALMADVEALIAPQLRAKDLRFVSVDGGASVTARADGEKLRQILLNLLSNSIKFTPRGGEITLTAAQGAEWVAMRVQDTGIGIPADKLEVIFDPFVQVGRAFNATQVGTGLGLAISRRLARAMGGDLTVESELGVGSTFALLLVPAV
jgi:PAS domain S-box-containing protein